MNEYLSWQPENEFVPEEASSPIHLQAEASIDPSAECEHDHASYEPSAEKPIVCMPVFLRPSLTRRLIDLLREDQERTRDADDAPQVETPIEDLTPDPDITHLDYGQ